MAPVHGQHTGYPVRFRHCAAPWLQDLCDLFRRFFYAFLSSGAPFFRRAFHVTLARP